MEIKIYDWMVNDLNLKKNELLVFAVIYNYQRGEWFNVPHKVIAQWVGISTRAISRIIQTLHQNGLIEYKVLCDDEVGCYSAFKIPESLMGIKYN